MEPFKRRDIYHWRMNGSYSLKSVLPVLVPEMTYEGLEIRDGAMASEAYFAMEDITDPAELSRLRKALLEYWYSQKEFGAVYTNVTVDGRTTSLGPDYLVGVKFGTALPDGAKQYMTVAAVLSPLPKGEHTVEISSLATGDAIKAIFGGEWEASLEYTVIVK
jgi:hypothetical protein